MHHPLVQKWLKAGILEDGIVTVSEKGTGQASGASPLLADVYLWAARWRRRDATGDMIVVRFAGDIVVSFEPEVDAQRFWDEMRERLQEFALSPHPDKTRLIQFGRQAAIRRAQRGRDASSSRGGPDGTACGRRSRGSRKWLKHVAAGFFNHHAVPTNSDALEAFRYYVTVLWCRSFRRQS